MTHLTEITSGDDASRLHLGVVAATWNASITDNLVAGALARSRQLGVGRVTVLRVPGSLELGVGARALIRAGCEAVAALGAIVKGDTDHYTVVVSESARALTLVALETGVPVANGVLAVHDIADAVERSRPGAANKGAEAVEAAVATVLGLRALSEWTATGDLVS